MAHAGFRFTFLFIIATLGCSGSNGPGADAGAQGAGGHDAAAPTDDSGVQAAAAGGDPLEPSPPLEVPGAASTLARALVGAPTFAAAYAATSTALTEGGIAVRFREMVTKPAKPPEASSSLFPLSVIDLAA